MPLFNSQELEDLFYRAMQEAKSRLSDTLLETCADQEYRICLLELGINL